MSPPVRGGANGRAPASFRRVTDRERPLSPRAAWALVAILTLANASAFVDRFVLAFLVTPIKADLHLTDAQVGQLLGLPFALFYAVAGIPLGWLADTRSRRAVVAASVAAWSAFTMGCGLVRSYGALFLMRAGVAVGEAGLTPPALSAMGDAFAPSLRATAMSVFSLGIFLGAGLANIVGGSVVTLAGNAGPWHLPLVGELQPWQAIFIVVGAPGALIALLAALSPEPTRTGQGSAAGDDAGAARAANARAVASTPPAAPGAPAAADASASARRVAAPATLWAYLREHGVMFLGFSLAVACFSTVNNGVAGWLPTFFQRVHGWTAQQAGLVAGSFTATIGVAGAIFAGRWADRLRAAGRADADLVVFLAGSVAMGITAVIFPLMPTGTGSAVVLALVNFPAAFPFGITFAAVSVVTPPHLRAQASALFLLITNLLGLAVGPWVVGVLTDQVFQSEQAIGVALACLAGGGHLLATGCMLAARGRFRRVAEISWN